MDSDGGNPRQLTHNEVDDVSPSWSPDGNSLVFASGGSFSQRVLYTLNRDGSDLQRFNIPRAVDEIAESAYSSFNDPSWSPDGRWIAVEAGYVEGSEVIAIGTINRKAMLIEGEEEGSINFDPGWAPDSKQIAYVISTDGEELVVKDICCLDDYTDVFRTGTSLRNPTWSPDGSLLAFAVGPHDAYFVDTPEWRVDLVVASSSGSTMKRVRDGRASTLPGSWAPDGSRLVVYTNRAGSYDIYSMCPDGTDARALTTSPASDIHPVWTSAP